MSVFPKIVREDVRESISRLEEAIYLEVLFEHGDEWGRVEIWVTWLQRASVDRPLQGDVPAGASEAAGACRFTRHDCQFSPWLLSTGFKG